MFVITSRIYDYESDNELRGVFDNLDDVRTFFANNLVEEDECGNFSKIYESYEVYPGKVSTTYEYYTIHEVEINKHYEEYYDIPEWEGSVL